MKALWSLFWQLLALRRGPEEMPRSTLLLLGIIVLNVAVGVFGAWQYEQATWFRGAVLVLLALGIDVLALWLLQRFKNVSGLYVQSLTAIYIADTLLSLAALPVLMLLAAPAMATSLRVAGALKVVEVVLLCWSLGVRGFIYHRSLNVGIFQGNMLAISLFLLTQLASVKIFPELLSTVS